MVVRFVFGGLVLMTFFALPVAGDGPPDQTFCTVIVSDPDLPRVCVSVLDPTQVQNLSSLDPDRLPEADGIAGFVGQVWVGQGDARTFAVGAGPESSDPCWLYGLAQDQNGDAVFDCDVLSQQELTSAAANLAPTACQATGTVVVYIQHADGSQTPINQWPGQTAILPQSCAT